MISHSRRPGATARHRLVDVLLIAGNVVAGFAVTTILTTQVGWPGWLTLVEHLLGVLGCLVLWWRRDRPVAVAVVLVVLGSALASVAFAPLVALYTVALLRPLRLTLLLAAANLLSVVGQLLLRPDLAAAPTLLITTTVIGVVAATAAGLTVRSRRALVDSLRERAAAAEVEARLRTVQAQHEAREELAREMHDVLGHRLSLLSVQAGALSYNRDSSVEDAARAVEEIRVNARRALQDLREVLTVLRTPEDDLPLPGTGDIPALVAEAARSGARTELCVAPVLTSGTHPLPAVVDRTLYRFVQEGLTNVRKHAPGATATVRLGGTPGESVAAEVTNTAAPAPMTRLTSPSSGSGLRGLAERAALVGGHVDHALLPDGGWRLTIRLPWPEG